MAEKHISIFIVSFLGHTSLIQRAKVRPGNYFTSMQQSCHEEASERLAYIAGMVIPQKVLFRTLGPGAKTTLRCVETEEKPARTLTCTVDACGACKISCGSGKQELCITRQPAYATRDRNLSAAQLNINNYIVTLHLWGRPRTKPLMLMHSFVLIIRHSLFPH